MGKKLLIAISIAGLLTGCGSGDINISPTTADNSVDNSVNNSNNTTSTPTTQTNPCASYVNNDGQTVQGSYDGLDCTYAPSFVDAGNNLTHDLTIPSLPDGGVNIFQGSLFVGNNYKTDADMAAAGITRGGDGPKLTIEAGATLAWTSNKLFMAINRGSQLFAIGTQTKPITFTSLSDVESMRAVAAGNAPTLAYDAVQEWGGIVINGFGITNKCTYTGSVAGGDLATTNCHVEAEGSVGLSETEYGGDNPNDSSGNIQYIVVKHTGAEVAPGDELNGISWSAVGSGTVVDYVETYSVYDDGMEFFGGNVDINHYVAVYDRDDSFDIDEGYSGTVNYMLAIQAEKDGNNCIESDGIGSFSSLTSAEIENIISQGINSRPTINNMTCIMSPNAGPPVGTHDPGAGWRVREGIFPTMNDSMIVAEGADSADDNYCIRIDNRSLQAAQDGDMKLSSVIFACHDKTHGNSLPNGTTVEDWVSNNGGQFATVAAAGTDPTATADTDLQLLQGTPPIYSIAFDTMMVDGAAPTVAAPASGKIGAMTTADTDWTQNWTYGIHDGSRDVPLWFE